jgi:TolB-like protein/Flp pilus assembly protein TadD
MIELRVLGSLDLRGSEGETVLSVLAQPKRAALLAYLAVASPRRFSRRDKLIGLFWPERDPEHARAALRTALHFLRHSLGEEVVVGRGDQEVGLAEGALWCDCVAFEEALGGHELEKALELYRGDLLEGFFISEAPEFERWLEGERKQLRIRAAQAAWLLAEREERAGNNVEAVYWARRAAAFAADDEGALRCLVELLDRVGDRAGAVREYQAFERRLREDYELEPSAETRALIASIREQVGEPAREKLGDVPVARGIRRIAVLPARHLPPDPGQDYFSDGITDQLINACGKIRALEVISRTSAMRYKGTSKTVPEIARELDVGAVVEVSVFRAEDRVRITAQLIKAATDRQLWAESYERDLHDVLALQGEVCRAIARQIQVTLTPDEEARLAGTRSVDPQAHEAYLRGMFLVNQMTPEGLEKGIAYLWQATELDPHDPRPYAVLARAYCLHEMAYVYSLPREVAFGKAKAAALKAIELDETQCEAHAVLGLVRLLYDRDWPGAEQEFRRAIECTPTCAFSLWGYALYLVATEQLEYAIAVNRRAQELDPLSPVITVGLAVRYYLVGQYDRAIAEARRALEVGPDYTPALWILGAAYERKGMYDEAIAALRRGTEVNRILSLLLAVTYAMTGRSEEGRKALAELDEQTKRRQAVGVAEVYAALGERDQAFQWLETAYQERDPWLYWLRSSPYFEGLRDDPRYHNLVQRMNFPD